MKSIAIQCLTICITIIVSGNAKAQALHGSETLSVKQQSIVSIAAFTANGNLTSLDKALHEGLDTGLTINEIKEVMVQLYAYSGFPRSLNALHTLIAVLKERKQKGIQDKIGREPGPLPRTNKLEFGTQIQTRLVGSPVKGEVYEFAPAIDQFLKEHLFGDIFGRDNLEWKTRELATIAALTVLGGVENQLRAHFNVGMYNGLTAGQLHHLVSIIQSTAGSKEGHAARKVLESVLGVPQSKTTETVANSEDIDLTSIFPRGEKIANSNFIGNAWLQQMVLPDSVNFTQVGSVTFEPGARTNWHLHPAGQILLITSGTGYYQEKGSAKRIIRKGEVIHCPPNIPHWHGASKDDQLIQVAITNAHKGSVLWMQPVTDVEYNK